MQSSNVVAQLEREAMGLDSNLPSCHELKIKILSTYIRLRLRIQSNCIRAERKVNKHNKGYLGSKSQTKKAISTKQTSSPEVITSRPLPTGLLIAMDVFGLSIPGPPSAAQQSPLIPAVTTSSIYQQPTPAPATTISKRRQPPPPAATNSIHQQHQQSHSFLCIKHVKSHNDLIFFGGIMSFSPNK